MVPTQNLRGALLERPDEYHAFLTRLFMSGAIIDADFYVILQAFNPFCSHFAASLFTVSLHFACSMPRPP